MNTKLTPWLLAALVILGITAWWSQQSRSPGSAESASRTKRVLEVERGELTQVRVRQDYWNSFVLQQRSNGSWDLVEPSVEPANPDGVDRLLTTLADLPVLEILDTPANDSERYRQYGLWSPTVTVTLYTGPTEYILSVGHETEDQSGTYCSVHGRDEVYVTSTEAVRILSTGLEAYRRSATTTHSTGGASRIRPGPTRPAE